MIKPAGHLIEGLTYLDENGTSGEAVFLVCDEMGDIPADVLGEIHARGQAWPPLDSCGKHALT